MSVHDVMTEHYAKLLRYARKLTLNKAEAEDLLHAAFERALLAQHKFRGDDCNVQQWLYTIIRNTFLSIIRGRQARPWMNDENVEQIFDAPYPAAGEALCSLHDAERTLSTLSDAQREAVELHRLCGLDYQEIARYQGVALGTVKSRISRAQDRLDTFA